MSGRSAKLPGRERRPRVVSQKRKAEVDLEAAAFIVKSEPEAENNDIPEAGAGEVDGELETRWEWQGDGDMWMLYSLQINTQINLAFGAGKRSVTVSPAAGVSLQVDMRRMAQKNTQSGYQRPIRLAVREQDQFFVWQWQSDEGSWMSYDAHTCVSLETGLRSDNKLVTVSTGGRPYTMDLGAMVQRNSQTQHERQIQRCLSVAADTGGIQPKQTVSNNKPPSSTKRLRGSVSVESEPEESKEQVRTLIFKGKAPIDPECSSKLGKAHVFCEGDDVYDVMLNQGGTVRHVQQHQLGEEYQRQELCHQPLQHCHSWHPMPSMVSQHGPQTQISDLTPSELLEHGTGDILGQSPGYTDKMAHTAPRRDNHAAAHVAYPQRKSTVWDFFHLKDPSMGIRNATSAVCNLCTREVKRGSTPGRLGTTAMRNHLAKHHQREWAATGSVVTSPTATNNSRHHCAVASTSQAPPPQQGVPLLRSVLDICYCFFATVCTLCGAVISRGETVSANREYLMLQHMQSAHCSILRVSLSEMQGGGCADDDSTSSSS
ncbi:hypothetical protein FKM82_005207 [Ascaphus truei]